ncbi:MAG: glucose dehydrogenase [Woeseiaceae bacterium]|nr:glucose dehydrogenase [Woeseiaceae bacterium]
MSNSGKWFALYGFLTIFAGCGGGGGGGSIAPPAGPPPPPPPPSAMSIDVQPVFTGVSVSSPVSMVQSPDDATRWYVVEQQGVVRVFDIGSATSTDVFVDIQNRVLSGGERGLLGIAFHPAYPSTPAVFLSYTSGSGGLTSRVSRFRLDGTGTMLDPGSEEILFTISQPASNHNGGDLVFGSDGYLYASFGDGGGSGDPNENGQNTRNLMGTIVRIDINGATPYDIPTDNPFASADLCATGSNTTNPCPEIYAWGLRNPWRISIDSATGNLWIGDVGQGAWEEVDRADATQMPQNRNFGWNDREGAHCFDPSSGCATGFIEPVTEYGRSLGQSITGGYVYRGSVIPNLAGTYIFGDFVSGRIFGVPADSQPTTAAVELLDTSLQISSFAESQDGELFVLDYGGAIYQIIAGP